MENIHVLIVDDHEMVRMGLATFLQTEPDLVIVGQAKNGLEAIELAKQHQPHVILMDLVMDGLDGVGATKEIMSHPIEDGSLPKIIVLTSFINDEKVFPAIEAGAFSYLLKTSPAGTIAEAIRKAFKGEPMIDSQVASMMMNRLQRPGTKANQLHTALTNRELEVLALLGEGKSNKEIGELLYIGIKTVKTHVSNILLKLEVEDRTQAAIYAVKEGLTKPS
ncbi:response regulator transcription factor [Bacillus horti]|uniref:NarL family two-component system response regulator LiaR n=1 Tax=Caldalkalibacillus horti TaxID=77523 RepID=A0ABT9VW30_9BACI|nr:response regulator transcription factor [Bacillus horti]MDQ0165079.1 NarL family two-component system response regulator LiaR [Bacillus horti]